MEEAKEMKELLVTQTKEMKEMKHELNLLKLDSK
jgi:hypothetical protein